MKILLLILLLFPLNTHANPTENLKSRLGKFLQLYQQSADQKRRFQRDSSGIITDDLTGLQWREGPDVPSSWQMAQDWIGGLGDGWRTPTLKELSSLYIPDSKRRGKYNDPLHLDETFQSQSGYSLWSISRNQDSAWLYDFSRGYAHWIGTFWPGHFDRGVAVRSQHNVDPADSLEN